MGRGREEVAELQTRVHKVGEDTRMGVLASNTSFIDFKYVMSCGMYLLDGGSYIMVIQLNSHEKQITIDV